ncbi:dynein light chain type 1 family protein [Artemisia annua]|uniref:Dynein light chain 1, cytoplasmic n=1 Tax=Artemisia annua TaxID=35608 RepID=A0A2U1QIR1_ARTAN|nr:dynein light chain type 1 family protein [Artemisia annua]
MAPTKRKTEAKPSSSENVQTTSDMRSSTRQETTKPVEPVPEAKKAKVTSKGFENDSVEKDVAKQIKEEFDKNHDPTSHCVVGRNFETNKMSDNNNRSLMPSSPPESSSDDRKSNSSSSSRKVIIKAADMKEDMQTEAVNIATAVTICFSFYDSFINAFENGSIDKDVAEEIKKAFDKNHGPRWHCIVGRNFGSYVTHETNHFVYFDLDSRAVLLFKSG